MKRSCRAEKEAAQMIMPPRKRRGRWPRKREAERNAWLAEAMNKAKAEAEATMKDARLELKTGKSRQERALREIESISRWPLLS